MNAATVVKFVSAPVAVSCWREFSLLRSLLRALRRFIKQTQPILHRLGANGILKFSSHPSHRGSIQSASDCVNDFSLIPAAAVPHPAACALTATGVRLRCWFAETRGNVSVIRHQSGIDANGRGGPGIGTLRRKDKGWEVTRDIHLGEKIPGYEGCGVTN